MHGDNHDAYNHSALPLHRRQKTSVGLVMYTRGRYTRRPHTFLILQAIMCRRHEPTVMHGLGNRSGAGAFLSLEH